LYIEDEYQKPFIGIGDCEGEGNGSGVGKGLF